MRNKISLIFLSVSGLSLCCCVNKAIEANNTYTSVDHRMIYRDSLSIVYTIKNWVDSDFWTFRNLSLLNKISNDEIKFSVEKVFYSPDHKKMIAWVCERYRNAETRSKYNEKASLNRICPTGGNTVYEMSAIVGFRSTPDTLWRIYPLDFQSVICSPSVEASLSIMERFYFNDMAHFPEYVEVNDTNYGGKLLTPPSYNDPSDIYKELGYNLGDSLFWNKSMLWQKGARIPGLYNFQTKGNVTVKDKDYEVKPPVISYPDSILQMFK